MLAVQGLLPRRADALTAGEIRGVAAGGVATVATELTSPILTADGVQVDKKEGVIIVRHAAMIYTFDLSCPHQNTALRWNDGNDTFQCPRHKSRAQPDGPFISGRATRSMDRFAVRRDDKTPVVNVDTLDEQDTAAASWTSAKVAL